MQSANLSIWSISAVATAGVLTRPFKLPEAVWAVAGGTLIVLLGLLPVADGWKAIGKVTDVHLFLVGMMLLSEPARREGLFDWVAAFAVNHAKGLPKRLFLMIQLPRLDGISLATAPTGMPSVARTVAESLHSLSTLCCSLHVDLLSQRVHHNDALAGDCPVSFAVHERTCSLNLSQDPIEHLDLSIPLFQAEPEPICQMS